MTLAVTKWLNGRIIEIGPNQFYRPGNDPEIPYLLLEDAAAPPGTVALTGQSVSAIAGALGVSRSLPLSGQSLTASAGSLSPNFTIPLVGISVVASAGTVTYNPSNDITLALSGQSIAVSAGTLGLTNSRSLSGSAVTASAGSFSLGISLPLSGTAVTVSAGTLVYAPAGTVTITVRAGSWIRYKAV